jgi:hypothetical protein
MKEIAKALAAAQMEMGKALKQSQNPAFRSKYADLGSVMDACMDALNKHGIAVVQPMKETEFGRCVVTMFIHESGDTLECPVPLILNKNDMQGLGSAYTYARRYGLMALAGIAPEDDDGNAAAAAAPKGPKHGDEKPAEAAKSWAQTILDELPANATDRDKAQALADNLIRQFQRKKSAGELSNEWDRRIAIIKRIEDTFPTMHADIVDAYESRMIEFAPREAAE